MLSLKERDDAPLEVKKVVDLVRQHVLSEYGEGPDHKAVRPCAVSAVGCGAGTLCGTGGAIVDAARPVQLRV